MIESLISSKTRVKLLLKFFLNGATEGYLRGLEAEFGDSSNAIRVELNRLSRAGLLTSKFEGNKRMFRANVEHPLYENIHQIVRKHVGLDKIVDEIVDKLGQLERVYLAGALSRGANSPVIDLLLVGEIDKVYLLKLVTRVEEMVGRKVRYVVFSKEEEKGGSLDMFKPQPLLLWDRQRLAAV